MSEALGGLFGAYHLWVAHYDVDCPRLVDGWQRWAFWQRSSSGRVTGVDGDVDLDAFAGTHADLRRLYREWSGPAATDMKRARSRKQSDGGL
jgi:GH25 family lysozyme M1 (1,4-beta-N-acetylmuramidase)